MRSYCMYRGNYLDIADMYEVIDGKQINIPEKLKYYRQLSDTHSELTCPCGCGEVVVLVAGSVRKQHFRLLKKFASTNCEYQEESELSINSKIVLKCWLTKNLPEIENKVRYQVPMNELTDSNRRYEMALYIKDYNFGIVYYRLSSNIEAEKIELQKDYLETKILYVTSVENEFNDDQYPEHLMMIQERQGYCFYLDMKSDMHYEDAKVRVCVYVRNYKGYWKSVVVCKGFLDQFKMSCDGELFFYGKSVADLTKKTVRGYQKDQAILQQKELDKEKKIREEQERQKEIIKAWEEQKRQEQIRKAGEEQERQENIRKESEERKKEQQKEFLRIYPKLARVYQLLLEMESISGVFFSDQSNGNIKEVNRSIKIEAIKIKMDKHIIEVCQENWNRVYFFVLEENFTKWQRPGTGVSYAVLDYTKIINIEHHFKTDFIYILRNGYKMLECTAPDMKCQFLNAENDCIYEQGCRYQRKKI